MLGAKWRSITPGALTCGVTESDEIYCWGYNGAGSSTAKLVLGQNDDTQRNQPGPTIADQSAGKLGKMGSECKTTVP